MAVVTGDRYLEKLEKFVEGQAGALIDGTLVLKLNPAGLHYVQSRLEALHELENLLSGAPVDYLRAYVSDLGDHRALEQLRRILRLLTSLKVVSVLPPPIRDPTPLSLLPFGRLRILELRGCDLSTSAAKGLLELRHTLEKIICHNSADALRHVFASRIAEIKESPQWNRLSFVSCACNRLLLMDESLQLLPAIETLDLSRNRFAKVDNLQRCAKLKHLDLGFNHLRSIASFSEVSCQIVKLVLRNNALTTLRGLENLKSLEALDVSYNIVSNFLELEFLSVLPALKSLWLEGNPLCSARWYRAQVFSYFARPDGMKLDDKEMSTREYWKRRIIIASRQKQPASFGFYSPAKSNAGREGNMCRNKRRKVSRLASIESEEESAYFSSDQESQSIDNELRSKDENIISDDEPEILDLINRVEHMKKERSIHWLREFKEWMDHESEVSEDGSTYCGPAMHQVKENHLKSRTSHKLLSKNSGHASDSLQVYGDETNGNKFVADSSLNDGSSSSNSVAALPRIGRVNLMQKHEKAYSLEELHASFPNTFAVQGDHEVEKGSISLLPTIDDTTESHSSSANPGSPPHYQEDILHRRHNLVEEFLQLSAESYSVASSDSDTSSGEDDFCRVKHEADHSGNEDRHLWNEECSHLGHISSNNYYRGHETHSMRERPQWDLHTEQASPMEKLLDMNRNDLPSVYGKAEVNHSVSQWPDCVEKMKSKRKIRRVDSLIETMGNNKKGTLENSNGNIYTCEENVERERGECIGGKHKEVSVKGLHWSNVNINSGTAGAGGFPDEFIEEYFNANVADSGTDESCRHYMRCDCLLEPPFSNSEREVALVLSNVNKLYILLIDMEFDESGSILSLVAWHKVEDVREVMFGLGLQVVRVYIEGGTTYMFLTRSFEKSKQLLYTLQVDGPRATNDKCLVRTLELVQVALFQKQIFGDSKLSIFQYSTVLFLHSKDKSWLSRSLFVSGCHVLICAEDLKKFSSPSMGESLPPYFSIDSCCSIGDISELIIDAQETQCVTLAIQHAAKECNIRCKACKDFAVVEGDNAVSGFLSWTLKWFSEDSLFNFVALLKAIHAFSPLRVTRVS